MEKPLLTEEFLLFINKLNIKNKTYLEIGSGNSTIYFSKRFKNITSLEHNKNWFDKLNKKNLKNVSLRLYNPDNLPDILLQELSKKPDFIMIDNDPRVVSRLDIAKFIHNNKKNDCIILLYNGTWNLDAFSFLRKYYYCLDFIGKRYDGNTSVTSVFFTNTNKEKVYESK